MLSYDGFCPRWSQMTPAGLQQHSGTQPELCVPLYQSCLKVSPSLCCCGHPPSSESGEEGNGSHRAQIEKKHNSQYGESSSEMAQIILLYTLISLN